MPSVTEQAQSEGYGIALQPVCDSELRHVGDKLLYRESAAAETANVHDAVLATARACASALFEIGLTDLVGNRFLLCAVPEAWVLDADQILYPPEQTILEIPTRVFEQEQGWAAVRRLQADGFRIALDTEVWLNERISRLAPVDVVKTDFRHVQAPPSVHVQISPAPTYMATFIETREELELARSAGFQWLQGFVFSLPMVVQKTTHKRTGNRAVELQLLAQLTNDYSNIRDIEPLLAQHPSLATMLLRQVNSASLRRQGDPIDTLAEALIRLGTQRVRMMVSTFMISSNDPIRTIQARELLVRAAMASNVAERIASVSPSVAFSIGLFSRLHLFEGQQMEDLIRELPFSPEVQRALLAREGELGKLLKILDAFETGNLKGLPEETMLMLNEDYLKANAWADRWLRTDAEA